MTNTNEKAIRLHMAAADRWDKAADATNNLQDAADDGDVTYWMEAIAATEQAQQESTDPMEIAAQLAWIQYTLDEGMPVEPAEAIDQAEEMAKKHRDWVEQLRA